MDGTVGSARHPVLWLHAGAPRKPAPGAPCNGCGVCCALEPCPLGIVLSRRRRGACVALTWNDGAGADGGGRYACGVVAQPRRWLPWLPAPLARRLALRWIGAAQGCDSDVEPLG